jgi:hypothetical protein
MADEALTSYAQTRGLLSASPRHLDDLRKWLDRPEYGGSFLKGKVEGVWDAEKGFGDFASIVQHKTLTAGLTSHLGRLILHIKRSCTSQRKPSNHLYTVSASTQQWLANGVMTVLSSVCPVVPIVILFFITDLLVRLGLILIFTAIMAGTLVFGMGMEPDKTLAITTA